MLHTGIVLCGAFNGVLFSITFYDIEIPGYDEGLPDDTTR